MYVRNWKPWLNNAGFPIEGQICGYPKSIIIVRYYVIITKLLK